MSKLDLRLFGGFDARTADGTVLSFPTKKAKALLAYLAVRSGKGHSRSSLASLLWGASGEEQARASLRQTLSHIRKSLGPTGEEHLVIDGDLISIDPTTVQVDVAALVELASAGETEDTDSLADLYRGDLLDGLDLREAEFNDWLRDEAARLRDLATEALGNTMSQLAEADRLAEALAIGHKLLSVDPFQESTHRAVMRIHLQRGERALALKQYEACRETLMRELDVEPDEETTLLAKEARSSMAGGATQATDQPSPASFPNEVPYQEVAAKQPALHGRPFRWIIGATASVFLLAATGMAGWVLWDRNPAPPLQKGVSIAVLPFENLSGNPAQEYFADGVTADLITDLSHVSGWSVIAYATMQEYRGRKIDEVAAELNVSHVITGRVRRVDSRIRINVDLVDATNRFQQWGQRYDRELVDVLKLQDEVVREVVAALSVNLTAGEHQRLVSSETVNPEAYDLLLRGLADYRRFTRATNIAARDYFERSLKHDPEFARAQAALALTYGMEASLGWADDAEATLSKGLEMAQRALALSDNSREVYYALAVIYRNMGRHEEGIASARRSVEIDPNYADGYAQLAINLNYAGVPEEGLVLVRKAQSLNPRMPFFYVWLEGQSHYLLGQHKEALRLFQRVTKSNPQFPLGHKMLVATYAELGQIDDAAWAAEELLTLEPGFTIEHERQATPYRDGRVLDAYLRNLHNAGLPIK